MFQISETITVRDSVFEMMKDKTAGKKKPKFTFSEKNTIYSKNILSKLIIPAHTK